MRDAQKPVPTRPRRATLAARPAFTPTPSTNLGANNGFEPVDVDATSLAADDIGAVAGTLLQLLGLRPAATAA